jgi:hypothetical protein
MPGASYRIVVCEETTTGKADDSGLIMVPVPPNAGNCTLEWGEVANPNSTEPVFRYRRTLNVSRNPAEAKARDLNNLAYDGDTVDAKESAFNLDYPKGDIETVHANGIPKAKKANH